MKATANIIAELKMNSVAYVEHLISMRSSCFQELKLGIVISILVLDDLLIC